MTADDENFLSNVAHKTHGLLRCDKSEINSEKKGGDVILFVPLKLALKERKDLTLFDQSNYDSKKVKSKMRLSEFLSLRLVP